MVPALGSAANVIDTDESTEASSAAVGHRPRLSSMMDCAGVALAQAAASGVGVGALVAAAGFPWPHERAITATRSTALMPVQQRAVAKRYNLYCRSHG